MSLIPLFQYSYPKLSENWDYWTLMVKLFEAFKIRPDSNDWFCGFSANQDTIIVHSARQLSDVEKAALDAFMSQIDAGLYPKSRIGFTVFQVKDLHDAWSAIESATGIKIKWVFWAQPTHDVLQIWVEGTLSPSQITKMKNAYAELITVKGG